MGPGTIVLMPVALIVGIVIGISIGKMRAERRYKQDVQYTQGTINVDCSDRESSPVMFLGLGVPIEDIMSRKYISLDVNILTSNSQE